MVTYFSEKDIVSFGNYCLSDKRRELYLEQGIAESKIDSLLTTINPIDIKNWFNLLSQQRQEDSRVVTETSEITKDES